MHSDNFLRGLRKRAIATGSSPAWQGPESGVWPSKSCQKAAQAGRYFSTVIPGCAPARTRNLALTTVGFRAHRFAMPGMTKMGVALGPRPLVAYAQEFHRPVRDGDPEGGADGTFHQMDVAAMGTDQFGGDREPEPAAAGPAYRLERLEQMFAGLCGDAGAGVGDLDDRDRAFAAPGDANLHAGGVAAGPVFERLRRIAH